MITMRSVAILILKEEKKNIDAEIWSSGILFLTKLMNTNEQQQIMDGQKSYCQLIQVYGTRTLLYFEKLHAHKFYQLHRIPIN